MHLLEICNIKFWNLLGSSVTLQKNVNLYYFLNLHAQCPMSICALLWSTTKLCFRISSLTFFFTVLHISTYSMWSLVVLFSNISLRLFFRALVGDDIFRFFCFLGVFELVLCLITVSTWMRPSQAYNTSRRHCATHSTQTRHKARKAAGVSRRHSDINIHGYLAYTHALSVNTGSMSVLANTMLRSRAESVTVPRRNCPRPFNYQAGG